MCDYCTFRWSNTWNIFFPRTGLPCMPYSWPALKCHYDPVKAYLSMPEWKGVAKLNWKFSCLNAPVNFFFFFNGPIHKKCLLRNHIPSWSRKVLVILWYICIHSVEYPMSIQSCYYWEHSCISESAKKNRVFFQLFSLVLFTYIRLKLYYAFKNKQTFFFV